MPELPDIVVYIESLRPRIEGEILQSIRLPAPFVLRTTEPSPEDVEGRRVVGLRRIGKRIAIEVEGGIFVVLHLMIAGRLRWLAPGSKLPGRISLAALEFPRGVLVLTEAGTTRRASLSILRGEGALRAIDPGGVEVLEAGLPEFAEAMRRENHTLKRSLTDPRLLSGIGNAYSDEILHRARLSPVALTSRLTDADLERLYRATREVLVEWTDRLRAQTGEGFPEKVTAFREGMAVHGRFRASCPVCGTPIQRIVHAQNETNYCPKCQTGGRLLADRALSRLLRGDWPRSLEELEERRRADRSDLADPGDRTGGDA